MDIEDLFQPEVAVGAAVAAAIFSPRIRGLLRRGAVYTLAGALIAGDAVTGVAKGVGQGAQKAAGSASAATSNATSSSRPKARRVPVATNGEHSNSAASDDNTVDGTILNDTETTPSGEDAGRE